MNMKNIGLLMNAKNIYFVPFGQDNAEKKPNSMIAHTNLLIPWRQRLPWKENNISPLFSKGART